MSEQSPVLSNEPAATASSQIAAPLKAPGRPFSAVIGSMALAISLGSAGLVGWFFYSWQPHLLSMQQQQVVLEQQQQQQQQLFQQQQQLLQQSIERQIADVVTELSANSAEQTAKQQQALRQLQLQVEQQSGQQKSWQLLEVDYFLKLAEQKLFLEQNVAAVVQILDLAEQRLKQMQDASVMVIREAISQDKRMLAELNTPDMHQLHLTLASLRQQSLTLPLRQSERPMDAAVEEEITESMADWQANLGLYWRNFWRSLVQVRASLPDDGVSLTAEQQISVRNTLTQQLLLAELAAMQHNQAVFAAAIQQSADSLQRYFAATEPAVQQMADELVVLSALQVSLPLLAPLKSPSLLDSYRQGTTETESAL